MKRILVFTDSRGQHTPRGVEPYPVFAHRLAQTPGIEAEVYLCPMKWTTTLDFLELAETKDLSRYDRVILYTGIVEWSPRALTSAVNDLYDNPTVANLDSMGLDTRDYSKKVVNNKKAIYDRVFGMGNMYAHMRSDLGVEYQGDRTQNMYSLKMAERHLLPILADIDNLLFINSNRFIPGWNGDYMKVRPDNIGITEQYSALFRDTLGKGRCLDLLSWHEQAIKNLTCDNLHLSKAGSDWVYTKLIEMLDKPQVGYTRPVVPPSVEPAPDPARTAPVAPLGRPMIPPTPISRQRADAIRNQLGLGEGAPIATLIIGLRLSGQDDARVTNLLFLLDWLERHYGDLFDILIVEQDDTPKFDTIRDRIRSKYRYEFIYNPAYYNRGWGYNVAARHFTNCEVIGLLDTDVLVGHGFVEDVVACYSDVKFVSPYTSVYFTDEAEAQQIRQTGSYAGLKDEARITKPVSITGGIFIARRTTYETLGGFDQYTGYGGEDRAFDVAILRLLDPCDWRMSRSTYVHLHHPKDKIDGQNLAGILEHLNDNYGCVVDRQIGPDVFIHQNCPHVAREKVAEVIARRRGAFGDQNLYRSDREIAINGVLKGARPDDGRIFPEVASQGLDGYAERELYQADPPDRDKLRTLYNAFQGERCVIIGNGPSLNRHDLDRIRGEYVFGVNSFFYKTRESGFRPTFYVVEDNAVMIENQEEIRAFDAPFKFFPTNYRKMHPADESTYFFKMNRGFYEKTSPNYCVPRFSTDASEILYCGQSVTFINLQLAFYMGFTEVYLIGMDFDYVIPDSHARRGDLIISDSDDPNHFHKDYFGKGKTWKDPKLDRVGMNYRQARVAFEAVGRKIYNATNGGKLELFERADYDAAFPRKSGAVAGARQPNPAPATASPPASAHVGAPTPAPAPAQAPPAPAASPAPDSLARFKDRHQGERCFIMGNGPSLNRMDLSRLAGETVFACNGVDLLFDRIDWRPTYYVSVDSRVLPDRAEAVKAMLAAHPAMTGFFPTELVDHGSGKPAQDTRSLLSGVGNAVFFRERTNDPGRGVDGMFSFDADAALVQPYTVTITMMQLAAWMGFSEIVLIGCDTDYVVPASVRQEGPTVEGGQLLLTSTADDDPNHFDPRYFGKGRRWHQPQVARMIEHYGFARQALEGAGIRVVNATVGGRLDVFERSSLDAVLRRNAGTPPELLVASADASGRKAIGRLSGSVPVMIVGDAADLGQGLKAEYLVGTPTAPGVNGDRLRYLAGDGSGLRRLLIGPDHLRALGRSDRALDQALMARLLWPDLAGSDLSPGVQALLWAQALGFRSIGLAGQEATAGLDRAAPVLKRLRADGISVRVIT